MSNLVDALTGQEIPLAMQSLDLSGRVLPMGAVLKITHRFRCAGKDPMEALYVSMLPRNASLRRFRIKGKGFNISSKLKKRKKARETYEKAIEKGHLAGHAEVSQDGMVTLSVGQVRPKEVVMIVLEIVAGVEMKDRGLRFRFPFTIAPSYHAQATTVATPSGGRIELPGNVFEDLILPEWKTTKGALDRNSLHQVSFNIKVDGGLPIKSISSPSHRVEVEHQNKSAKVKLAGFGDTPNRDLVLDVKYKKHGPVLFVDESVTKKGALTENPGPQWSALVPSTSFPKPKAVVRKVCFVVDRSGSMGGITMEQAQRGTLACISALSAKDRFGLIRFDNYVESLGDKLCKANKQARGKATEFIRDTTARGGTELGTALKAACKMVGKKGEIFLFTDGQVFGGNQILEVVRGKGIRVHCLGIGAASQDRFLAQLAEITNGVARMVGPREGVDAKALELFNAIRNPVLNKATAEVKGSGKPTEIKIDRAWGDCPVILQKADRMPPQMAVFSAKHLEDPVKVKFDTTVPVPDGVLGLLWAAKQIEQIEGEYDLSPDGPKKKVIKKLQGISQKFSLASREMSLVAVVKRKGDKKGKEVQQTVVPVGMPEDMETFNLYQKGSMSAASIMVCASSTPMYGAGWGGAGGQNYSMDMSRGVTKGLTQTRSSGVTRHLLGATSFDSEPEPRLRRGRRARRSVGTMKGGDSILRSVSPAPTPPKASSGLMDRLAHLEPDGGFPGADRETRILATILLGMTALNANIESGTNLYGAHLERMASYLEAEAKKEEKDRRELLKSIAAKLREEAEINLPAAWAQDNMVLQDPNIWTQLQSSI